MRIIKLFNKPTVPLDVNAALTLLKTNTTYDLSIVLIASALLKNNERYSQTLATFQTALLTAPDNSFKAWMIGRMLLAATNMQDHATVEKALPVLKKLLPEVTKDEYYAWALGYLAAVSPEEYIENQSAMITAANSLTKPADALWSHVMNLQAAARAKDETTFEAILQQMKTFTKKESIAAALAEIPATDWQAWALGITAEAATTIGNKDIYNQLTQPTATAIIEAVKSDLTANAMLAQISITSAASLMLEKSPRPPH